MYRNHGTVALLGLIHSDDEVHHPSISQIHSCISHEEASASYNSACQNEPIPGTAHDSVHYNPLIISGINFSVNAHNFDESCAWNVAPVQYVCLSPCSP